MKRVPPRYANSKFLNLTIILFSIALMIALSTSHQNLVIFGFATLHDSTSGFNSSSLRPISIAPMALSAPTDPP